MLAPVDAHEEIFLVRVELDPDAGTHRREHDELNGILDLLGGLGVENGGDAAEQSGARAFRALHHQLSFLVLHVRDVCLERILIDAVNVLVALGALAVDDDAVAVHLARRRRAELPISCFFTVNVVEFRSVITNSAW